MPTKIKVSTADEVIFRSDRKCVVCGNPGHQIHHIDGNNSNHVFDNLAYLCFADHDDASTKGGLSRKLSPGVIKNYRALHYKRIAHEREVRSDPKHQTLQNFDFLYELCLDAMVSIEVGKMKNNLSSSDWDLTDNTLMRFYSFPPEIGLRGREAILGALEEISSRTRDKMPSDTAFTIGNLVTYIVPSKGGTETVNIEELNLYKLGLAAAFNIAYDGIKYLGSGKHVRFGLEIIYRLARYSGFNITVINTAFREIDRLQDISKSYAKMDQLINAYKFSIEIKDPNYPVLPDKFDELF